MISIVVVVLNKIVNFLEIFIESISNNSNLIKEIIIVNVDKSSQENKYWNKNGINFKLINGENKFFTANCATSRCAEHAYGLHLGLKEATQLENHLPNKKVSIASTISSLS